MSSRKPPHYRVSLTAVVKNGGRAKKKVHGAASSFWKGWEAKEAHLRATLSQRSLRMCTACGAEWR